MKDLLGPEVKIWHWIEGRVRSIFEGYGFEEIRTPVVEYTQVFKRGVGTDTDIVEKEMYTFDDRSGDSLSLRPEGTASVVRALIEHNWLNDHPVSKLYYMSPMFRHERPQKGRYRQFHQYGIELIGVEEPYADAEVIEATDHLYKDLGLKSAEIRLSSVGCRTCRPVYKSMLTEKLNAQIDQIPEDFRPRIITNPQRIFDHKSEAAQKVAAHLPFMLDHLCEGCRAHFMGLRKTLDLLGVKYEVDPKIVRGLDYYNRTAFEFVSSDLGSQSAVCGGGRYDHLFEDLGHKPVPAVGFAGGFERLAILLESRAHEIKTPFGVYFVHADERGFQETLLQVQKVRKLGVKAEMDLSLRPIRKQMARADKSGAQFAVILGGSEVESGLATVKNLVQKTQESVSLPMLAEFFRKKSQEADHV